VVVLNRSATVNFRSRSPSGLHFNATFDFAFDCPTGYALPSDTARYGARCTPLYTWPVTTQTVVYVIASFTVLVNVIVLGVVIVNYSTLVIRAASGVFCVLILAFNLLMAIGAYMMGMHPFVCCCLSTSILFFAYDVTCVMACNQCAERSGRSGGGQRRVSRPGVVHRSGSGGQSVVFDCQNRAHPSNLHLHSHQTTQPLQLGSAQICVLDDECGNRAAARIQRSALQLLHACAWYQLSLCLYLYLCSAPNYPIPSLSL
jgi:hypothetical protein